MRNKVYSLDELLVKYPYITYRNQIIYIKKEIKVSELNQIRKDFKFNLYKVKDIIIEAR